MSEEMESVKLRTSTMGIIREWAEASGRTVSGLASDILDEAASHYMDGTLAGPRVRVRARVNGMGCPKCKGPTLALVSDAPPYRPTGRMVCMNAACTQEAFWPYKANLMDAPNGFDPDVSFPEGEHVGQRGWGQE